VLRLLEPQVLRLWAFPKQNADLTLSVGGRRSASAFLARCFSFFPPVCLLAC